MTIHASRAHTFSKFGPYAGHIDHAEDFHTSFQLDAGDRVGGPPRRRRGRLLSRAVFVAMVAGSAWLAVQYREEVTALANAAWATVMPLLERKLASDTPAQPTERAEAAQPLSPLETREAPPTTLVPASAEVPTALPKTDGAEADPSQPVEALPPPVADPSDPLQVRAIGVGLHPRLSRALLARFSEADFRNAETAIKTALAEASDNEVFAYPRKRAPELAWFQVKFVRGISPECRRYVVMVTKDGWLTTAMPMEKCGIHARQARKGN